MLPALLSLLACNAPLDPADTGGQGDTDTSAAEPPDWVVDCKGGGDFSTVQQAIDAAVSGDTIAVNACTYRERIDYSAKSLDIYGVDGSGATTLDGRSNGTVVRVVSGESLGTRLAGVTIRGGYNPRSASAIAVHQSSLTLEDVVLTANGAAYSVLYAGDSFVTATELTISGNTTPPEGMGIYSSGGGLTGNGLHVDCDTGGYGIYQHNATTIDNSSFSCAGGYGFYSHHGELRARRSSFSGGVAGLFAAESSPQDTSQRILLSNVFASGATGMEIQGLTTEIINSVITGTHVGLNLVNANPYSFLSNSVVLGAACGIQGDGGTLAVDYTAFWDNTADTCSITAAGTYAVDPGFAAFPTDLTLRAGSPLIDAGDPAWLDVDGSRSDVGVYGGPKGSW